MEDRRSGVGEGRWKRGRAEEERQERKEEERQIRRRRKGRKEEARQGGGREGRPFEPGSAFEFEPDFKTLHVWSKILLYGHKMYECVLNLRPNRYSGSTQTAVIVRSKRQEERNSTISQRRRQTS